MSSKHKAESADDSSESDADDDKSTTTHESNAHAADSARAAKRKEQKKTDDKAVADSRAVKKAQENVKAVVKAVQGHDAVQKKLSQATDDRKQQILQKFQEMNEPHGSRTMQNLKKKVSKWWHELKNFLMPSPHDQHEIYMAIRTVIDDSAMWLHEIFTGETKKPSGTENKKVTTSSKLTDVEISFC